MPRVMVNGRPREIAATATLADLVRALGHRPEHLLAEVNGQVVELEAQGRLRLHDGDQVELLAFVGGG